MIAANDPAAFLSVDDLEARLATMPDDELRDACVATDRMPGDEIADLLAGECERRNLDS